MGPYNFDITIGAVNVIVIVPRPVAKHEWKMGQLADSGAVRTQAIARVTRILGEHGAVAGDAWRVTFSRGDEPRVELVRRGSG